MYENVIGFISSIAFMVLIFIASFVESMDMPVRVALIVLGLVLFFVGVSFCIKIETEAGKYECGNCGHRYVPKYSSVYFSQHIGRTRKMVCPKCGKKTWQKKVVQGAMGFNYGITYVLDLVHRFVTYLFLCKYSIDICYTSML